MTSSLIIDSDGGIDDAVAILTLASSVKTKIALINATTGNVGAGQAYKNIVAILNLYGKKIEVSKGRGISLTGKRKRAHQVHGKDGLGNTFLVNSINNILNPLNSLEAFRRTIERNKTNKILAIGPLTNIASVFLRYPFLSCHLDEVWVVGGTFKLRADKGAAEEFNFYFDPRAAEIVFSAPVSIRLISFDVTERVLFDKEFIENFEKRKDEIWKFIFKILNFSYNFNRTKRGLSAAHLPDLVAACLFLNEGLADFRKTRVSIDKKAARIIKNPRGREVLLADNLRDKKIKEQALYGLLKLAVMRGERDEII